MAEKSAARLAALFWREGKANSTVKLFTDVSDARTESRLRKISDYMA